MASQEREGSCFSCCPLFECSLSRADAINPPVRLPLTELYSSVDDATSAACKKPGQQFRLYRAAAVAVCGSIPHRNDLSQPVCPQQSPCPVRAQWLSNG